MEGSINLIPIAWLCGVQEEGSTITFLKRFWTRTDTVGSVNIKRQMKYFKHWVSRLAIVLLKLKLLNKES